MCTKLQSPSVMCTKLQSPPVMCTKLQSLPVTGRKLQSPPVKRKKLNVMNRQLVYPGTSMEIPSTSAQIQSLYENTGSQKAQRGSGPKTKIIGVGLVQLSRKSGLSIYNLFSNNDVYNMLYWL